MKRLILSLTCLLVAGTASAVEIKIVSEKFEWKQNFNNAPIVQYFATTGCQEIERIPHIGLPIPVTKSYQQKLKQTQGETFVIDYKGKSSICRYRANDVQLPFGAIVENSNKDNEALIRIYHDKNAGSEVKIICKKVQHTGSASYQNYITFDCKAEGSEIYVSGNIGVSADLSRDVTVYVELDPESLPL